MIFKLHPLLCKNHAHHVHHNGEQQDGASNNHVQAHRLLWRWGGGGGAIPQGTDTFIVSRYCCCMATMQLLRTLHIFSSKVLKMGVRPFAVSLILATYRLVYLSSSQPNHLLRPGPNQRFTRESLTLKWTGTVSCWPRLCAIFARR